MDLSPSSGKGCREAVLLDPLGGAVPGLWRNSRSVTLLLFPCQMFALRHVRIANDRGLIGTRMRPSNCVSQSSSRKLTGST
jgi:hypothetical protein